MIKAPKTQSVPQIEEGTYIARCYSMIQIGTSITQFMDENGDPKKINRIRIGFELPTEMRIFKDISKPLVISQKYTLSLHKKSKIRPMLEAWRGKKFTDEETSEFDWTKLMGVPAMITIVHNDKGYAEIVGITKPPKGIECPMQVNANQVLEFDNFNTELFDKLPEFLKDEIKTSDEYKKMTGQEIVQDGKIDNFGDEMPFGEPENVPSF